MSKTYLVEVSAYTYVDAHDKEEAVSKVVDAMNKDYVGKGGENGDGIFFKDIDILNCTKWR